MRRPLSADRQAAPRGAIGRTVLLCANVCRRAGRSHASASCSVALGRTRRTAISRDLARFFRAFGDELTAADSAAVRAVVEALATEQRFLDEQVSRKQQCMLQRGTTQRNVLQRIATTKAQQQLTALAAAVHSCNGVTHCAAQSAAVCQLRSHTVPPHAPARCAQCAQERCGSAMPSVVNRVLPASTHLSPCRQYGVSTHV
jgi:hypothetical protein